MPPELRAWPRGFGRGRRELDALLVLSHLQTLTPRGLGDLARAERSAAGCLEAVRRGASGEGDREAAACVDVAAVRAALTASGARVVAPPDPEYPKGLLHLADPPALLFVRGAPLDEAVPAAAVVGARSCSAYGREVAASIGRGLASAGVGVVSGAARGIDTAAHRGALAAEGRTLAVLGSGIDVPYPVQNGGLIEEIARVGSVVSEYPPGTPPHPRRFPARNRIVAGLAEVVVVVEGADGSGSLISADFAGQLGRDVLAVPGPVTSPLSAAPHALIRDGAGLARGPEDVLEAMHLPRPGGIGSGTAAAALAGDESRVLGGVTGAGVTADVVAARAGIPVGEALSALASLELRGLIRAVGGRYERRLTAG